MKDKKPRQLGFFHFTLPCACVIFLTRMPNKELEKRIEEMEAEESSGVKQKPPKKTVVRYVLNILFVLIVTALALFLSLKDNFNLIVENLRKCNYLWILFIVGVMVMMILCRGLVLFCFARLYTRKYHIHQALAVDQIGVFYNAVTPGASGGEIMQAYTYKKQGVPISSAVSIMAMYSIIFQSVLIIYGLLSFFIKYDYIIKMNDLVINLGSLRIALPLWLLTILGFLLNVSVILIVLLMAYWRGFHNFIMGPVVSFLHKIRIVKDADKKREDLRVQVENFKIEFRRLLTNIPFTILIAVLFFIYMTLKFSVPYFVGMALGNASEAATFWDAVFLSNYHQMVTGLIPIPGSAGVSEWFFHELFINSTSITNGFYVAKETVMIDGAATQVVTPAASESMCRTALLLWRSLTFAFPIITAGLVTAFYKASPKDITGRNGAIPNRHTLTQIQAETLDARTLELGNTLQTQQLTKQAVVEKLREIRNRNRRKKSSSTAKEDRKEDVIDIVDEEDEGL